MRIAGGETHLVVHDDVHRAAGAKTARLRELQGLLDDALAGKRSIAVNLHRQHLVALGIAAPLLTRARRAFDHGVHDFQMRWVERERDVHVARRRLQIGRKALVIFDVARTAQLGEVIVTFELVEQILRCLAEKIDEHVETAAMRHADDGLFDAGFTALLHQIVEQRNQGFAAFQRKSLLTHVLGVQVALENLRGGQLPQYIFLLIDAEATAHALRLKRVLQPQTLVAVGHMGELGADGVAVNKFELAQNIFELDAFGNRFVAAVREELGLEIGIGQTEILDIEDVWPGAFLQAQRIEIRDQVAAIRVNLNEARYRTLFGAGEVSLAAGGGRSGSRRTRLQLRQPFANCRMRNFGGRITFQPAEVLRPGWIDRRGILQKLFVEILDKTGISAGQSRSGQLIC